MPNFPKKKSLWYSLAASFFFTIFTLVFFSQPSFAADPNYCSPLGSTRCNSKIPNLIQACGNCDTDSYNEWCNTTNCAATEEVCSNGRCQSASGCIDTDEDGYGATGSTGCSKSGDCNINNRDVHPGAAEICGNGIDEDCLNGDLIENWSCENWLPCVEGYRNHTCTDANNCGTFVNRPPSRETCATTIVDVKYPANGNSFTLNSTITFKVSITPNTLNNVSLYSKVNGGAPVFAAWLYDDGAHGDTFGNDGIWGKSITLGSVGEITFELRIGGVSYPNIRLITVTNPPGACIHVNPSQNPDSNKLDVVYIGDNYTAGGLPAFETTVDSFYKKLFDTEPFKSQKTKINIHLIKNTADLGCIYNCNGIDRLICCNVTRVREIASACPYDEIIVLMNSDVYGGGGYIGGHFAMSYRGDPRVAIHEFGHSFAGLRDEYIAYSGNGPTVGNDDNPNCDGTAGCAKWNPIPGMPRPQCLLGCTYQNWYRSIDNGYMKDLNTTTGFGLVNMDVINNIFNSCPYINNCQ